MDAVRSFGTLCMAPVSFCLVIDSCYTCERTRVRRGDKSKQWTFSVLSVSVNIVLLGIEELWTVQEDMVSESPKNYEDYLIRHNSSLFCSEYVDSYSKESVMLIQYSLPVEI